MFGSRRLLGFGLLAATFLAGALTGAAVDRTLSGDDPRPGPDRERGRSYVIDRIEMSADQRAEIDDILERRSVRMRTIWNEVRPRLDSVTDSARSEIMEVLTPDQRAEYERQLRERRRDRSGDDGPGDAGPGDDPQGDDPQGDDGQANAGQDRDR